MWTNMKPKIWLGAEQRKSLQVLLKSNKNQESVM